MREEGYVIVTGSTQGIGKAIALRMAQDGYDVVINGYGNEQEETKKANAVLEEIAKLGQKGLFVYADVSNYGECKKFVQRCVDEFGKKIACFCGNAGIAIGQEFHTIPIEKIENLIGINLMGNMYMSHLIIPYMVEAKNGCLTYTSSIGGAIGYATHSEYAATKGALMSFVKALGKELGPYNVRANCVGPGTIATEMAASTPPEFQQMIIDSTPLRRFGKPEEIADAFAFVLENKFVTGQNIQVNGGVGS